MNMENTKDTKQMDHEDPHMLAIRAKKDIYMTGTTEVRCPKCHTAPIVEWTPRGERTIVSCKCGYVHDVEINF